MMIIKNTALVLVSVILLSGCTPDTTNQDKEPQDISLFFREDWKQIPPENPVTQNHVQNPELLVKRHGPGGNVIKKSHHDNVANDPWYIWSGLCQANWALSLQTKNKTTVNLSKGKIRWRTYQSGGHVLHIILQQHNGTWLVSEGVTKETANWHVFTTNINEVKWYRLDIQTVIKSDHVDNPDLSRIQAIGWTDLTKGGGSAACSRVDWIEVYGTKNNESNNTGYSNTN